MDGQIKIQNLYSVNVGPLHGAHLVLIESISDNHYFLQLPENLNICVSHKDVVSGLQEDVLTLIETLPKEVFMVCKKQFQKNGTISNN